MSNRALLLRALWNALGATAYIVLVAAVFSCRVFNGSGGSGIIMPMAGLLLFVFSALVMGALLLLSPLRLYLDGQKIEGVRLLMFTGMWMGVITLAVLASIIMF
jgi:hypothetical protein